MLLKSARTIQIDALEVKIASEQLSHIYGGIPVTMENAELSVLHKN